MVRLIPSGGGVVELRQARYFLAIVEAGTISRAAETLHIAQSAVSQQILRLERELGVALFDRSRRAVQLTRAGADFVPAARALIDAEEAARRSVGGAHAGHRVRIGVTGGLDARLFRALQALRDGPPPLIAETVALSPRERLEQVRDARLDLALLHGRHDHTGVIAHVVGRDALSVLVSDRHRLAGRDAVDLADLVTGPLVLQADAIGTAVADVVLGRCRQLGVEPTVHLVRDAGPFPILSAPADAWSVFYTHQARMLDGAALGLHFLEVADADLAVELSVLAPTAASALAERFAALLRGA